MKESLLNEGLHRLIVAHRRHDERAFQSAAEALIRELAVANRHSDARRLQEALAAKNGHPAGAALQLSPVPSLRGGNSLIAWQKPNDSGIPLVLSSETADAIQRVIAEHRATDRLARNGLRPATKLLFWGPPGCGKTASAKMLSEQLGLPFGIVRLSSVITSYVGETAANIARIFEQTSAASSVILFDEADALAKDREDANDVGELKRVVNSLLQSLDEFQSSSSVLILASNHQHMFDSAVWRRFDEIIEFPLPTAEQRMILLKSLTNGMQVKGDLKAVAKQLDGLSFADIERIVRAGVKDAVLEDKKILAGDSLLTKARRFRKQMSAAKRAQRH